MTDPDYQVRISKDGNLEVVNPESGDPLTMIPFNGHIMKACAQLAPIPLEQGPESQPVQAVPLDTLYTFGHFASESLPGGLHMQKNPKLPDSGYEIEEQPGQPYPRLQYWSMYGIFTMDMSSLDPKFRIFQVANRREEPVRLWTRLTRPWGEESVDYVLRDERIPLYPWDSETFDFATTCPVTGGEPKPLAYIQKNGDVTRMTQAWVRTDGVLARTL